MPAIIHPLSPPLRQTRPRLRRLSWIALVPGALALACGPQPPADVGGGGDTTGGLPPTCTPGDRLADDEQECLCASQDQWACIGPYQGEKDLRAFPLLARIHFQFFVDDSIGMAAAQSRLALAMDPLAARLAELDLDFSVGVTTTDAGQTTQACPTSTPAMGAPRMGSCRERLDQFVSAPNGPGDPAASCTDVCDLPSLELAQEPGLGAPTHMLTSRAGVLNVLNAQTAADALRCMIPQGNGGCDLSAPLAAMDMALGERRVQALEEGTRGFQAGLVAIVLTDGVDCSVQDPSILDPAGAQTFWPDPQASLAPPAVCWNAGVECVGGPGTYESCQAADFDATGAPAQTPKAAALQPAAELANRIQDDGIHELLVLAGVPEGYPSQPIAWADASDPQEQQRYGIGPGCETADTRAQPPARLLATTDALPPELHRHVGSVCAPDHGAELTALVDRIAPRRATCVNAGTPRDMDPEIPGVQPLCHAEGAYRDLDPAPPYERRKVPLCTIWPDGGWSFPSESTDHCLRILTGDDLPSHCDPDFDDFAFVLERAEGASLSWFDTVTFNCLADDGA